jgi:hypothetical protein
MVAFIPVCKRERAEAVSHAVAAGVPAMRVDVDDMDVAVADGRGVALAAEMFVAVGEGRGIWVEVATFVAVGVGIWTEVDVSEMDVDDAGTVLGCAFAKSVGTELAIRAGVARVEIRAGDCAVVLLMRRKKRISRLIATINLKRS